MTGGFQKQSLVRNYGMSWHWSVPFKIHGDTPLDNGKLTAFLLYATGLDVVSFVRNGAVVPMR